ncbi:MAG TPA: hypothetical protein VE781_17240, partial [Kineosporiaceae bacterium]|nr:hypothetical protein [Kineosporiaceae bacterium]
ATTPAPPSGPALALPAGLPTSGPGADAPGAELVAALAPGGVVDVHERLVVHYRLTGALVAASPAPPGRRTLVLRPVSGPVAAAAGDPVLVRLDDARVGAVYCPAAPSPLCAVSAGAVHVATVPAGTPPLVLAQVTLR